MEAWYRQCLDLVEGTQNQRSRAIRSLLAERRLWSVCQEALQEPDGWERLAKRYRAMRAALPAPSCDPDGPETTVLRMLAAAIVACLSRHAACLPDAAGELLPWAYRAANLEEPGAEADALDSNFIHQADHHLAAASFAASRAPHAGWSAARGAALTLLGNLPVLSRMPRIPILFVDEQGKGIVAYLSLTCVRDGIGALLPAPPMLHSLEPEWRAGLADVWQRTASLFPESDVFWEISLETAARLDGKSAQAAFEVALRLLARGWLYDTDCAISAAVGAGDSLAPVEGIVSEKGAPGAKLNAAREKGIRRVVIAPADHARLSCVESPRDRGLEALCANTIGEAMEIVSRTAQEIKAYLEHAARLPDADGALPAYLGGKKYSDLYVAPDALKRERRVLRTESRRDRPGAGEESDGRPNDPRSQLSPEALDIGESLYGDLLTTEEWRRVSWEAECPQIRRAALLAPPGQGKSLLLAMTARLMAQATTQMLESGQEGLAAARLPIPVKLDALAKADGSDTGEAGLRNALETALVARGVAGRVARYLADHAHEERAWLLLDALDEVANPDLLSRRLAPLKDWRCHVLITSRPNGYTSGAFGFIDAEAEYRLAEFSPAQARAFVGKRLPDGAGKERMERLLATGAAVQQVSKNPYLLTLLSWVVERDTGAGSVPSEDAFTALTRSRLYERVVTDLLGLNPGTQSVETGRGKNWMRTLGPVALAHFQQQSARLPLSEETLQSGIAKSEQRPVPLKEDWTPLPVEQTANLSPNQQAAYLIGELQRKRFLVPGSAAREAFLYPHRSLVEFLAGWQLAREADADWRGKENFVDRMAWLPDWEEVIKFMAGCMDDPGPLLELLADAKRDDDFRHRLALAALCLPEIAALIADAQAERRARRDAP